MASTFRLSICLLLCLVFYAQCLDAPDFSKAKEAFEGIKESLKSVKDNKIVKKVMVYGKVVGHSAMAVKNLVKLIQTFTGGPNESEELKFMREQFAIINTKMDALDYDFQDVKNLIDWTVMKVNIGEYERAIKALEAKMNNYFKAPPAAAEFFGDMFTSDYIRSYNDAALKIYIAMSSESSIFQENILRTAQKQLKNDQTKISDFAGYLLRIINRGIVIENAYLSIYNKTKKQEEVKADWVKRFKKLETFAAKMDQEIHNAWSRQYTVDVDEFAVRNANLNNRDMATQLMKFLNKKYPWRAWFIFVYTFTNNNDKDRYFENCNGFTKVNAGNKVVIVNSMDPGTKNLKSHPNQFFRRIYSRESGFAVKADLAKIIYQRSPSSCNLYYFKGAFESKSQPSFWAPTGHFFSAKTSLLRAFHNYKNYELFVLV